MRGGYIRSRLYFAAAVFGCIRTTQAAKIKSMRPLQKDSLAKSRELPIFLFPFPLILSVQKQNIWVCSVVITCNDSDFYSGQNKVIIRHHLKKHEKWAPDTGADSHILRGYRITGEREGEKEEKTL